MAAVRAPKQWSLTTTETITSIEAWENILKYILSLDHNFASFLTAGATWLKKTNASPLRAFTDDGEAIPQIQSRTAAQKVTHLEMMLGQIANYAPVISRNTIVRNSTSISGVWQAIRQHYGLQSTGSRFLDLANIKSKLDQRPEDLYQFLMSFVEDNLLTAAGRITHHGITPEADEVLSPSLENFIAVTWLKLLHPDLPRLVKQRYGTELRCRTLAFIKPEISQALDSLLEKLCTSEEAKVLRTIHTSFGRPPRIDNRPPASNRPYPTKGKTTYKPRPNKSCALCLQAGRPDYRSHFLSTCQYLPDSDRQFIARARHVTDIEDTQEYENNHPDDNYPTPQSNCDCNHPINHRSATCRVNITQSPYLHVFYNQHPKTSPYY
jgi:hypothetical protein